ncbi:hypothetical protein AHAS_Ahas10G0081700 [Arachis hypogaea]
MTLKIRESSSRKRKEKALATGLFDINWFSSKTHEDQFNVVLSKKKVIPEVQFDLQSDEYLEIWEQILRRGWEVLCNPVTDVGVLMVRKF